MMHCLCSHSYLLLSSGTHKHGTPAGPCLMMVSACNSSGLAEAKDEAKLSIRRRVSLIQSNPSQMSVLQKLRRTNSEPSQQPSGVAG